MSIWVGIDEVGYGPKLGPLVLGLYSLKGCVPNNNFWLEAGIEQDTRRWKDQLVVCDSKDLYKSKQGIQRLETSARVLMPGAHDFEQWLSLGHNEMTLEIKQYPWYRQSIQLPFDAQEERVFSHRKAYCDKLKKMAIEEGPAIVRPVLERRFNSLLKTYNKSTLEFDVIMKMLEQFMTLVPGEELFVDVDKLGGRDYYAEILASYFPMQEIQIVSESRQLSHYRLPKIQLEIRFAKGSDRDHFPVAAASLLAKYTRELFMKNLNSYWCGKIEGLEPTAGYPEDAKRYMYVVQPQLVAAGFNESWMVREK